jgi:hypothetical protein
LRCRLAANSQMEHGLFVEPLRDKLAPRKYRHMTCFLAARV